MSRIIQEPFERLSCEDIDGPSTSTPCLMPSDS